jgi:hypothetical protein
MNIINKTRKEKDIVLQFKTNLYCEVLDRKKCDSFLDIVLLEISHFKKEKEYSTHIHNLENGGITNGHYFVQLKDAEKDFNNRN